MAIYLPMLVELSIAVFACARIGAVHSVVFAGFSAESLAQRIIHHKPKALLTCNVVRRGAKVINLKEISRLCTGGIIYKWENCSFDEAWKTEYNISRESTVPPGLSY